VTWMATKSWLCDDLGGDTGSPKLADVNQRAIFNLTSHHLYINVSCT